MNVCKGACFLTHRVYVHYSVIRRQMVWRFFTRLNLPYCTAIFALQTF